MSPELWIFIQQVLNGVTLGATYSLVAIGYTLVFGVLKILNLAHGDIMMMGAFGGMLIGKSVGLGFISSMFGAALFAGLLGVVMERLALRPLTGASELSPLISTIGISIMLQSLATRIFGPYRVQFPNLLKQHLYRVGKLFFTSTNLLVLIISILLMVGLKVYVHRTQMGRAIRATAEDYEVASFLGINVGFINWFTVGLASALAGIAGVLLGLTFGVVSPYMGIPYGLKGMVTLIVGGTGSIEGALVAGLLLGVTESLTVGYLSSAYRDAVAFLVLLVVLLVRPSGLFGSRVQVQDRV